MDESKVRETGVMETKVSSGYAPVNGLQMYYEIHGQGRPLVLLHGAFSAIGSSFQKILPALAMTRQVIAVDQQGHGRTADIDRPLSPEQMADDTAALLRFLKINQADLYGYSMGGGVAMELAVRHPELVRKIAFAGGVSYHPDGQYPELAAGMDSLTPEVLAGSPWQEEYAQIAPRPEDWPALISKVSQQEREYTGWSSEKVKAIQAPMLLIIGDADIVRPEHVVEMFRLLGGGVIGDLVGLPPSRLAILPGTTHVTLLDRVDWLLSMITEFFDAPMPGMDS